MDKFLFKRGNKAKLPQLQTGEPFLSKDEERLYIGGNNGNIPLPNKQDMDEVTTQLAETETEINQITTQLADIMGLNNFNIIPTYTNDLLTKVEEKDGDTIKSMSTITYNSDGTVKSVTDTLNGKSVMYTFNYVNDQLQSISRQVGV